MLSPFGPGNPALVCYEQNLTLIDSLPIGKNSEHLKITVEDEHSNQSTLLWWNGNGLPLPKDRFDLAYTVHASTFKGIEQVQSEWVDFRESINQRTPGQNSLRNTIINIDLRTSPDQLKFITEQLNSATTAVWQEGFSDQVASGCNRLQLTQAHTLVIWTAPPEPALLKSAFLKVKPSEIVWVLHKPAERNATAFLKSLWGLVSSLPRSGGHLEKTQAYSRLACTDDQLDLGLRWLCAAGRITIQENPPESVQISHGGTRDETRKTQIENALARSLAETNAYTTFLMHADLERLVTELG